MRTTSQPGKLEGALRCSDKGLESPAIFVKDVEKSFPISLTAAAWVKHRGAVPRRVVLHDISLQVRTGELFGLLGPNGAGKTTLLKMLATLCIPDRGQILISGLDARKQPMAVKQKIGLCTSEERSFYFRLTARENLRFFASLLGLSGNGIERRVEETARSVDLTFALDRRFDSFSSGMRQRLSLARALLGDPDVIYFDEPTRAVDPLHARDIRALIRELVATRGKTAVLATNLLEEAWEMCDTVAILQDGRIVANGAPRALDSQSGRFIRYHVILEGQSDHLLDVLRTIEGVRNVSSLQMLDGFSLAIELDPHVGEVSAILSTLASCGVKVKSLRSEDPQPLDVFVGLTKS